MMRHGDRCGSWPGTEEGTSGGSTMMMAPSELTRAFQPRIRGRRRDEARHQPPYPPLIDGSLSTSIILFDRLCKSPGTSRMGPVTDGLTDGAWSLDRHAYVYTRHSCHSHTHTAHRVCCRRRIAFRLRLPYFTSTQPTTSARSLLGFKPLGPFPCPFHLRSLPGLGFASSTHLSEYSFPLWS
jgi:hypothetical protein